MISKKDKIIKKNEQCSEERKKLNIERTELENRNNTIRSLIRDINHHLGRVTLAENILELNRLLPKLEKIEKKNSERLKIVYREQEKLVQVGYFYDTLINCYVQLEE
jgi:hypothetical protein